MPDKPFVANLPIDLLDAEGAEHHGVIAKVRDEDVWVDLTDARDPLGKAEPGTKLMMRFIDHQGVCEREVTLISAGNPTPARLVFENPGVLPLVCRRQFFRVDTSLAFTLTPKVSRPGMLNGVPQKGMTQDLSAGGMRFRSSLPLQVGDPVQVTLPLLNGLSIVVPGQVALLTDAGGGKRDVGVSFKDVPERVQDKLITFLLDVQRRQRAMRSFA